MAEQQNTDDFETAFAQFSTPDDKSKNEPPADAAQAGTDGGDGAATGGDDAGSKNDAGTGADNGDAAGDSGDAGTAAGAEGDDKGKEGDEVAAAASAAEPGEGEGGKEKGKADEGAAKPGAEAPAAGPSADDILTGLKDLIAQGKKPEAEEGADKQQQTQEEEKPLYTEDETEFLKEYDKEWSDVARGEGLKRRQEYRELLNYVFTQVAEYIKPVKEMAEAVAERTHRQDIETNITDYSDNLREDVISWVKEQPAYLQPAYNHVITNGTVEEVKDLVDRYRAATGKKPAGAGTQKPAGKKDNELSDEAKKAAESLAPVDVKRSGVQAPSDPANFDDAWKQFAIPDQT